MAYIDDLFIRVKELEPYSTGIIEDERLTKVRDMLKNKQWKYVVYTIKEMIKWREERKEILENFQSVPIRSDLTTTVRLTIENKIRKYRKTKGFYLVRMGKGTKIGISGKLGCRLGKYVPEGIERIYLVEGSENMKLFTRFESMLKKKYKNKAVKGDEYFEGINLTLKNETKKFAKLESLTFKKVYDVRLSRIKFKKVKTFKTLLRDYGSILTFPERKLVEAFSFKEDKLGIKTKKKFLNNINTDIKNWIKKAYDGETFKDRWKQEKEKRHEYNRTLRAQVEQRKMWEN